MCFGCYSGILEQAYQKTVSASRNQTNLELTTVPVSKVEEPQASYRLEQISEAVTANVADKIFLGGTIYTMDS